MGLRPQVLGLKLNSILATRGAKSDTMKQHIHKNIKATLEYNTQFCGHEDSEDSPITEDRKREIEDEMNEKVEFYGRVQKSVDDWIDGVEHKFDPQQDMETNDHIHAMIDIANYVFMNAPQDEKIFFDSDGYNGGGAFDEVAENFQEHLSDEEIDSLQILATGRSLYLKDANMDIEWSFYAYLTLAECEELLSSLTKIWEEYQKDAKSGNLIEPERSDDDSDDDQPKRKKRKISKKAKYVRVPQVLNEFMPDLISWLTDITSKKLDFFLFTS
jgi:hypothetical protein